MNSIDELGLVFSIFHDATISSWSSSEDKIRLKLDCLYLAKCIDARYAHFYLDLIDVKTIECDVWTRDSGTEPRVRKTLDSVFEAELDIMGARVESDAVWVTCMQTDPKFLFEGGVLKINCSSFILVDQANNILTVYQLELLSKRYWDKFGSV